MVEIRRILAPTDFSHHAEAAVAYAAGLAERLGAELHLLHVLSEVVTPIGPDPMLVSAIPPEFYTETEAQSQAALESLLRVEWGQPTHVVCTVRWGDAIDVIHSYARDQAIDLIVISTHGRTGLGHVLLGSVAERIVREAPCPVLTIRDRERS